MFTDLYKVLGVRKNASTKTIKTAYRTLCKKYHPDIGGSEDKFKELAQAYEVLSDPDRRRRYDSTGRIDEGVTKQKVREFIFNVMRNVVNAERQDGSTDDPVWENILDKILDEMGRARDNTLLSKNKAQRKLQRVRDLLHRFKALQEDDPVGDVLRDQLKIVEGELRTHEDACELYLEGEKVLRTYKYEVGPGPEGQHSPGPTIRLRGSGGVTIARTW